MRQEKSKHVIEKYRIRDDALCVSECRDMDISPGQFPWTFPLPNASDEYSLLLYVIHTARAEFNNEILSACVYFLNACHTLR